jgi:hypothetical protein
MSKPEREIAERAARRLLEALIEPAARAEPSRLDAGAVVVVARRKGVSVPRASAPAAAVDLLLTQGLARWDGQGADRRLLPTDEGRAFLGRQAAPKGADPFRAQHSPLALHGGGGALLDEGESPLAWLARRKDRDGRPFLAPQQLEAGERFRRDVTQAQLLQRVTADWEASGAGRGGSPGASIADVAIDARRRLARASAAVGPDLAGLLTDVCGYLKGLELVETERGWPHRSAKVVLRIALDRLAAHYGLAGEARGPERARGLLHWGAEDYRPRLE